jgi:hypothetical protein
VRKRFNGFLIARSRIAWLSLLSFIEIALFPSRSPVTHTQYAGYSVAFLAVAYYNYTKFQAAKIASSATNRERTAERAKLLQSADGEPLVGSDGKA